eukprot:8901127-Lingulodinium_polyedra.AAC.1
MTGGNHGESVRCGGRCAGSRWVLTRGNRRAMFRAGHQRVAPLFGAHWAWSALHSRGASFCVWQSPEA